MIKLNLPQAWEPLFHGTWKAPQTQGMSAQSSDCCWARNPVLRADGAGYTPAGGWQAHRLG